MALITLADFPARVLGAFPALAEDFADDATRPRMQLGAVARLMQRAKGAGDWATYARAAALVDELWAGADAELRGALNVALLEHLDFSGPRGPRAWACLSPPLQRAWRAMEAYNRSLQAGGVGARRAEAAG